MQFTFRPLPIWPHATTPGRRHSPFRVGWQATMDLLERELRLIGADNPIIAAGFREYDIRLDGLPRANALQPSHPGIELSFDSNLGRLVYATDVCWNWQDNVRSIALGLEALRAVDRFGITQRGQQYAGFLQLGSTNDLVQLGKRLVEVAGGMALALKEHSPDYGGERSNYEAVIAYKKSLEG